MLEILRRIEKRGSLEKLRKVRQYCNQIFRYAIATGRATVNPASELTSTLATPKAAHFPHLRADELLFFSGGSLNIMAVLLPAWRQICCF